MNAAETYIAMMDAANAQRARIHGAQESAERWSSETSARRLRFDPHRSLNANMEGLASFLEPTDVLLDVGGGAGLKMGRGTTPMECSKSLCRIRKFNTHYAITY